MSLTDYLARLEKLDEEATNGPWTGEDKNLPIELKSHIGDEDAALIAEARYAIPKLVRMVIEFQKWLPEGHSAILECERIING